MRYSGCFGERTRRNIKVADVAGTVRAPANISLDHEQIHAYITSKALFFIFNKYIVKDTF